MLASLHKRIGFGKADFTMLSTDVLTTNEAATFLRFTTRTVYKLASTGVIPSRRIGRSYRFSRVDLQDYLRGKQLQHRKWGTGRTANASTGRAALNI